MKLRVDAELLATSIRYRVRYSVREGKNVGKKPTKKTLCNLFNISMKELQGLNRDELHEELMRYFVTIEQIYMDVSEEERRKFTSDDAKQIYDLQADFYMKTLKKLGVKTALAEKME